MDELAAAQALLRGAQEKIRAAMESEDPLAIMQNVNLAMLHLTKAHAGLTVANTLVMLFGPKGGA
jgi:hypothetical protein